MGRAKAIAEDRWRGKVIGRTDMPWPGILPAVLRAAEIAMALKVVAEVGGFRAAASATSSFIPTS
jgi:hypothetical protein